MSHLSAWVWPTTCLWRLLEHGVPAGFEAFSRRIAGRSRVRWRALVRSVALLDGRNGEAGGRWTWQEQKRLLLAED